MSDDLHHRNNAPDTFTQLPNCNRMKLYSLLLCSLAFCSCGTTAQPEETTPSTPAPADTVREVNVQLEAAPVEATAFKSYEDAAIFLKGLINAESDNYGNLEIFRDGSWGQRCAFRLSDVDLSSKEIETVGEYYGGEVGPRVEILVKCRKGPCISDPLSKEMEAMGEKSFFVTDIAKGRKAFSTLITMQKMLTK